MFPVDIEKFLWTPTLKNICEGVLLEVMKNISEGVLLEAMKTMLIWETRK